MQIIPAIDLRGGKVVRLVHGDISRETIYFDDPTPVAKGFEEKGATRIHVVDLDGAFSGSQVNDDALKYICSTVDIPVQTGGGIRDFDTVAKTLNLGVDRVILGTAALKDKEFVSQAIREFGSDRIIVGIDAREGKVATEGWVESSAILAQDFALEMQERGVKEIIYTDILRDGTLKGPNFQALENMANSLEISIIASGGVSSLEDLRELKRISHLGITGAIVGQAIYTGKIDLSEAIKEIQEEAEKC